MDAGCERVVAQWTRGVGVWRTSGRGECACVLPVDVEGRRVWNGTSGHTGDEHVWESPVDVRGWENWNGQGEGEEGEHLSVGRLVGWGKKGTHRLDKPELVVIGF